MPEVCNIVYLRHTLYLTLFVVTNILSLTGQDLFLIPNPCEVFNDA